MDFSFQLLKISISVVCSVSRSLFGLLLPFGNAMSSIDPDGRAPGPRPFFFWRPTNVSKNERINFWNIPFPDAGKSHLSTSRIETVALSPQPMAHMIFLLKVLDLCLYVVKFIQTSTPAPCNSLISAYFSNIRSLTDCFTPLKSDFNITVLLNWFLQISIPN